MKAKHKRWLKAAAFVAAGVVAWDFVKAHTGVPRPQGRGVNQ